MRHSDPMWPFFLLQDAIGVYLAIGVMVALGFVILGVTRVDHAAKGAYAFRALLVPGIVMLWPYIGLRWLRAVRHGSAHAD
jgi:VIT1/CCC1 family predicted Fe2+/Mn2+ transporter